MKKISLLSMFLFATCVASAGLYKQFNDNYNETAINIPQDIPEAPRLRMQHIVTSATNMMNSFVLMHNVQSEQAATNAIIHDAIEADWRASHPDQKYTLDIRVIWASNDVANVTLWTDWLANNPTNGLPVADVSFYTNKRGRVQHSFVDVNTNWVWTARLKRDYERLQKEYNADKYVVTQHLSEQDLALYKEQCAKTTELRSQLKLLQDNLNYLQNYASITNNRMQAKLKAEREAAEKKAKAEEERKNSKLNDDELERYWEIADEMEDLGISVTEDDLSERSFKSRKARLAARKRGVNLTSRDSAPASTNSVLSKRLQYVKKLSKDDQRILRVGSRTRQREPLKTSLTPDEWAKFEVLNTHAKTLTTHTQKVDWLKTLSDEDRLIYKSGRRINMDAKIEAKKMFQDPGYLKRKQDAEKLEAYKKAHKYSAEDAKKINSVR